MKHHLLYSRLPGQLSLPSLWGRKIKYWR